MPVNAESQTVEHLHDEELVSMEQALIGADGSAAPFPLDAFPAGPLFDMARAIVDCAQVPESLAGSCLLGALSTSIGAGLQIRSLPERISRANLSVVASAQSGTGKSVAFALAFDPIHTYQHDLITEWRESTLPTLKAEKLLLEDDVKRLRNQASKQTEECSRATLTEQLKSKMAALSMIDRKLLTPKIFTEDCTVQALADVLARDASECTASLSADAGEAINVLFGRYNQTKRTDDSLFVKGWTGDSHTVDRKTHSYTIVRPCVTTVWLLQQDKLDDVINNRSLADGGFAPRLLICHTDCRPQYVDRTRPLIELATKEGYRQSLLSLLTTFRRSTVPLTIDPSLGAREALDDYHDTIVDRRRTDLSDITSYAARWAEQAWRIAVCLHAAKWLDHAGSESLDISTAKAAIRIAEWFAVQQLELLERSRAAASRDQEDRILLMIADKPQGASARDIYKPLHLKADAAEKILARMEGDGKIIGEDVRPSGGGHSMRRYKLLRG